MDNYADEVEQELNQIYLAVYITYNKNGREINAGLLNMDERKFLVIELQDNEHFSNFESLILQLNPQNNQTQFRILINFPALSTEKEKLKDIIIQSDIEMIEKEKKSFPESNVGQDLDTLLEKPLSYYLIESTQSRGLVSVGCIIQHLKLVQEKTNHKQYKLQSYTLTKYMKLDLAAMNALSIFPKQLDVVNKAQSQESQASTLVGLLDKCKTQIGSRCLRRWIKQPLQDKQDIDKRLSVVEVFTRDNQLRQYILDYLRKIPDLDKLYAKFYKVNSKKKHGGSLIDCVKVYQVVKSSEDLVKKLKEYMSDSKEILEQYYIGPLKENLEEFSKLSELVEQSIDIEKTQHGEYIINPSFSPALGELSNQINQIVKEIDDLRQRVSSDLEAEVKLVDSGQYTYLFEINKKIGDEAFRRSKNKYKSVSVKNKSISFSNQQLTELVVDYNDKMQEYKEQQKEIVYKILDIVSTYYPAMETASSILSELDCLMSFASVAISASRPYVRPRISVGGKLILNESRHPCLEIMDSANCISNDCEMDKQQSNLHLITGPNMGGKSTYIRQIAICVLMAHIGCFVPCESADIPIIDAIITRVGASDAQLRGISTFMSEMLEASCMLKIATSNSLLIVDELGRGTSTTEGFGIAWGIAEYIVKHIKGFCLFATHFHEMTTMEHQFKAVKNFYVSAVSKQKKLTMMYKVQPGAVDRSYGIYVAEILQFPQEILNDATRRAKDLEKFENQMAEEHSDSEEEQQENQKNNNLMEQEFNNNNNNNSLRELAKNANMKQKEKTIELYDSYQEKINNEPNPQLKSELIAELKEKISLLLKGNL